MTRAGKNNQSDLAREIGVKPQAIQYLLEPKNGATGSKHIAAIAEALDVSAGWLSNGAGDAPPVQFPEGKAIVALHDEDPLPHDAVLIRESRVRFAGGNGHITPEYEEIEDSQPATYRRSWFTREGMNPAKVRRFQVTGHSMEPFLFDTDTVLVNMAETDVRDGKVYALRYGDELRVKRCYRKLDGSLILHSDNPDHKPRDEEISPSQVNEHITIIGRVREKAGNGGL
ncbi:MAG: hypothetical protein EOO23_06575 [Comamonadaceae bacterium]|nr:MAG: hypothetical protein EOO23_06575 [Comamonadaceae bacterium]